MGQQTDFVFILEKRAKILKTAAQKFSFKNDFCCLKFILGLKYFLHLVKLGPLKTVLGNKFSINKVIKNT